ncbi:EpsG family protein [Aerococcus urinaeequi]|uniref:EpsG family protein n=1 Tax=Aerococcus urinaeequi TaxID=51665 RepID=UPI003D6C3095
MAVYVSTIVLVLIFSTIAEYSQNNKKDRNLKERKLFSYYFGMLTAVCLILVAGLRWRVGTDYWNYARLYSDFAQNWWNSLVTFNEPGIRIIAALSSSIHHDSSTMFFIASLITVSLSVWTMFKYSNTFSLSILLYIFVGAWHGSFNGVRQYLACAILFAGHRYIIKREFRKYFLIVFLASTFHISALSMIVLYFVPRRQLKHKDIILLGIFIILGLSLYDPALELVSNVLMNSNRNPLSTENSYVTQQVSILRIGVMVAPTILYLIINPKDKLRLEDNFYINMLFINASVYIITMNSAYFARFAIYTNIYIALGFPKIFKGVDKKLSLFIIYIALILYAAFWSYEIMITDNLRNYQWIFWR